MLSGKYARPTLRRCNDMKKILTLFLIILLTANHGAFASSTEAILQYNQGIDYYKNGQYDDSIGAFRQAIRLDPDYIDAYYNLGSVLEYLQQYDAALTVFKQIIVRKPDDYDSVYKAAWLSYKIGENQKAKTYLAIIPSYSTRSKDAYALASQLNFSPTPPTLKTASSSEIKSSIEQTNQLYTNIPAPTGITSDKEGNIYVAEFNTNIISKITLDNKKMIYLNDSKINGPIGLAIDKSKNMYIANYNNDNVLKVSPYGEISVLIGNVKKPYYLYIDENMLFISCQGSNSVLKYKLPQ